MAKRKNNFNINADDYEDFEDYFYEEGRNVKKFASEEKKEKLKKDKRDEYADQRRERQREEDLYLKALVREDLNEKPVRPAKTFVSRKEEEDKKVESFKEAPKKNYTQNKPVQNIVSPRPAEPKEFTYGPNTREIRGFKIDYDGVKSVEKIEEEYNGRMTYGIKFFFKGAKGSTKVIWFGGASRERDHTFVEEVTFFSKLIK